MRIAGWHIDGFGHLADLEVHDLPAGLVVLHGANEAGKSTTVDFLTGVLFGFPQGSTRRPKRPPLRGGAHGGKVWLADAHDSLLVSRGHRSLVVRRHSDDAQLTGPELAMVLGGATRSLFEAVFAVDVDALSTLAALDDEQLNDLVFSAGVIGAGRTARSVIATLDAQRHDQYRKQGRAENYRILALRANLREAEAELSVAQRAAAGVAGLRSMVGAADAATSALRSEIEALAAERERLTQLIDLWPGHLEALAAEEALAHLAPPRLVVEPGTVARLTALADEWARSRQERTEAEQAAALATHAAAEVVVADEVLVLAPEADRLRAAVAVHRRDEQDVSSASAEAAEVAGELAALLDALGPGHDRAWLDAAPAPGSTDAIEAAAERLTEALRAEQQVLAAGLQTEHRLADDAVRLEARIQALRAEGPTDPTPYDHRLGRLATLARLLEHEHRAPAPAVPVPPRAGIGARAAALPASAAAAAVLGVAAVLALASGLLAAAFGAALGALGATLAAATVHRQRAAALAAEAPADAGPSPADRSARVALVVALGLAEPVTSASVGAARSAEQAARDEVAARAMALAATAREQRELEAVAATSEARRSMVETASVAARQEAVASWRGALAAAGLPERLTPDQAFRFLAAASDARARLGQLRRLEARTEAARVRMAAHEQAVAALWARAGGSHSHDAAELAEPGQERSVALLDQLGHLVAAARTQAAQRVAAEHEAQARARAALMAVEREQAAERALSESLHSCGAASVAGAEAALAERQRRIQLEAQIEAFERSAVLAVGSARAASVRSSLASGDPGGWVSSRRRMAARIEELAEQRDALVVDLAGARERLAVAERSSDVAAAALNVAGLRSELRAEVRSWMVRGLARGLVSETLARYQRERQPQVLARAQQLFSLVTDGRYPHLRADDGVIVAVDRQANDVESPSLSRGTREQLYLCLRFALAESYAERTPLPIFLDDVLVNMDDERAPRVAAVVAEVARRHQVLAFTCNARTRDLLLQADPAATLVPIDRTTGELVPIRSADQGRSASA